MGVAMVGETSLIAFAGAAAMKIIDKIPWSKLWNKGGNQIERLNKDAVKVIISEHQLDCTKGIYMKIDSVRDSLSGDIKSLEKTIVSMLMQDREGRRG